MGGRHIHHLVFGIIILLLVGYGWLCEIGNGADNSSIFLGRLMSILYGVGAALTLDEFALWLNLKDVYWAREGRASIDAVILFGALLAAGSWGAPLFDRSGGRSQTELAEINEPSETRTSSAMRERQLRFFICGIRRSRSRRRWGFHVLFSDYVP